MAVKNSLTKVQNGAIREAQYESNGVQIKLDTQTVKNYLVNGNKNLVTDQDVVMFMELCRAQKLNPFIKDAYLVKYSSEDPATIVTSKAVFQKRANRHPAYNGFKAGVIVWNTETNTSIEREGTVILPNEKLIGGWAKVYRKDISEPFYSAIGFSERAQVKKDGKLNSTWAKQPGSMIRKCALSEALRDAFPEDLSGLYGAEEMEEVESAPVPQNIIDEQTGEIVEEENVTVVEKAEEPNIEDLF